MTDTTDYPRFRQRLDTVLRTRDVSQVRAFLIEEDQWSLEQPVDPEYAMWLMIAGTPTLKDLFNEAHQWLLQHGHTEAAEAVAGRSPNRQSNPTNGKRGTGPNKKKRAQ